MRKDNELLILANRRRSKQTLLTPSEARQKERKLRTKYPTNLQGQFRDYLTNIDASSPCEVLPPDYQNHLDRKFVQKGGISVEAFREYCEQLDADDAEIRRTEERLF